MKNLFDMSNRVVIITGAAGNLGYQYAMGLSGSGANVVLADINYNACKKIAQEIKSKYSSKKGFYKKYGFKNYKKIFKN